MTKWSQADWLYVARRRHRDASSRYRSRCSALNPGGTSCMSSLLRLSSPRSALARHAHRTLLLATVYRMSTKTIAVLNEADLKDGEMYVPVPTR